LSAIDAEISRLQEARKLLSGVSDLRRAVKTKRAKRTLSPEARARIAAAQKSRWARQKKAAK
jgi:hypothetical protein